MVDISLTDLQKVELESEIQEHTAPLGMQVRFQTVSHEDYTQWVEQQGKARHIVTLLARQITAAQIAECSRANC